MSTSFGDAGQHLAVVNLHSYIDTQVVENHINHLHQLQLVEQRGAANHVGVALVELAVAAFLRPVGAPHGLQLVAAERQLHLVAMLHHEACERHREVVAQALLGGLVGLFAAVLHAEQQFVALVAVFAEEGGEGLHRRGLYLRVSEGAEDALYGVENVISLSHFLLGEVSHSFRYRRFVCHRMQS